MLVSTHIIEIGLIGIGVPKRCISSKNSNSYFELLYVRENNNK